MPLVKLVSKCTSSTTIGFFSESLKIPFALKVNILPVIYIILLEYEIGKQTSSFVEATNISFLFSFSSLASDLSDKVTLPTVI